MKIPRGRRSLLRMQRESNGWPMWLAITRPFIKPFARKTSFKQQPRSPKLAIVWLSTKSEVLPSLSGSVSRYILF